MIIFIAGKIEYFEKPSNQSVNKFNVSFLKKVADLFAGITYILYLWSVKRNKLNIKHLRL